MLDGGFFSIYVAIAVILIMAFEKLDRLTGRYASFLSLFIQQNGLTTGLLY